jgi:hypothetical protein
MTAHRRAAGRAAPTPPLLTRVRSNTPRPLRGRRLPVPSRRSCSPSATRGLHQGSGTHLAGQVAVAGDGALVNIGKARKRAKKGTGSSESVQDMARRVREWGIHKPPFAKHSAWGWAFKYKNPIIHNPAGYEHQALCSLCLQAKDLETATSASVERLFSVAGQVVTAKRARLDPSTVTLLVFLHEAIPGGIEREADEIIDAALEIQDD